MWHTSRGDRTLDGDEATLVREAIDTMIDGLLIHLDDELDPSGPVETETAAICESGVALYDACTPCQRIGLLHDVARHLLAEPEKTLPLSAMLEATIAAIFVEIRDHVAIEINFPQNEDGVASVDRPGWRHLVASAYRSLVPPNELASEELAFEEMETPNDPSKETPLVLPQEASCDIRHWEEIVDFLADAILWDRDFELSESFLDIDPGISSQRRRLMGIDEDYFTRVPPDPRADQVFGLVSKTREIVRAKPR